MKKVITLCYACIVYSGGLPEDVVKEPKVKAKYYEILPVAPVTKEAKAFERNFKVEAPVVVPVGKTTPEIVQNVAAIEPTVSNWYDNLFLEAGIGWLSTRESIKRLDACGDATECYGNTNSNLGVLGRVGYAFDNNIDVYGEVSNSRGELDWYTLQYIDMMLGARYTAYDTIKVFGSVGKQKATVRSTKMRDVYKVGAGYLFNDSISAELSFKQTGKLKYPYATAKNRQIGLWLIYTLGGK